MNLRPLNFDLDTNSQPEVKMSSDVRSNAFHLLDVRIQRFIWSEGWASLREAQEAAIPLVLKADCDVIIAAATAAGKTEAAFLPALTHLLKQPSRGLIIYVSPLKALINDQFGRLERLCDVLDLPVWPWHGDITATTKKRFLARREGVLLITPESLEALLCNRGTSVGAIFEHALFFIVDELHSFIGSERGKQMQSLMHRIDCVLARRVTRIGLSATLGELSLAADFLRPGNGAAVRIVDSKSEGSELKILLKGYEEPISVPRPGSEDEDDDESASPAQIATHLFKVLRGSNNLVFPNSRREVERYTHLLSTMCLNVKVPNEFWPHHGNLSKEIRTQTEFALKQKVLPATAICTNTLELGIDIGAVKCVAQINPPPSVASVRQRLGRSGRRSGEPAILRAYCQEGALDGKSSLDTVLRLRTTQMIAMVLLLLEQWFEPPKTKGMHLSTLVQQVLSFIAQNGGADIGQLYALFCAPHTPFAGLEKAEFANLIRHLGSKELLMQSASGILLHGVVGERFINHYSFYAAFAADEEFRVVASGKTLGTIPISQMLNVGQRILFAGKTWRVDDVDEQHKTIFVTRALGGVPPSFNGGTGAVHSRVRQRMRELLESNELPVFLDQVAQRFLTEAREAYAQRNFKTQFVIDQGREIRLLTWLGDATNQALVCLLRTQGITASPAGPGIEIDKGQLSIDQILGRLMAAALARPPTLDELLKDVTNLQCEKWDWALPDVLLRKAYASIHLDLEEARSWIKKISCTTS
jgi:ATP-dependent helicase Lhr and Lhr-like helicase